MRACPLDVAGCGGNRRLSVVCTPSTPSVSLFVRGFTSDSRPLVSDTSGRWRLSVSVCLYTEQPCGGSSAFLPSQKDRRYIS